MNSKSVMMKPAAWIGLGLSLLLLAGCFAPKEVQWDWPQAQQQVLAGWGERQIVAQDLGFGMSGQFYLDAPKMSAVADSKELLWLDFSGEVEFSIGNGQVVYEPVPIQLQLRTRLRLEEHSYLLLEPEVKSLQLEFPIELMNSLLADTLAGQLSAALVDKPLFPLSDELLAFQKEGPLQLQVLPEGLRFSLEPEH